MSSAPWLYQSSRVLRRCCYPVCCMPAFTPTYTLGVKATAYPRWLLVSERCSSTTVDKVGTIRGSNQAQLSTNFSHGRFLGTASNCSIICFPNLTTTKVFAKMPMPQKFLTSCIKRHTKQRLLETREHRCTLGSAVPPQTSCLMLVRRISCAHTVSLRNLIVVL